MIRAACSNCAIVERSSRVTTSMLLKEPTLNHNGMFQIVRLPEANCWHANR